MSLMSCTHGCWGITLPTCNAGVSDILLSRAYFKEDFFFKFNKEQNNKHGNLATGYLEASLNCSTSRTSLHVYQDNKLHRDQKLPLRPRIFIFQCCDTLPKNLSVVQDRIREWQPLFYFFFILKGEKFEMLLRVPPAQSKFHRIIECFGLHRTLKMILSQQNWAWAGSSGALPSQTVPYSVTLWWGDLTPSLPLQCFPTCG